jgi:hypothetical protein
MHQQRTRVDAPQRFQPPEFRGGDRIDTFARVHDPGLVPRRGAMRRHDLVPRHQRERMRPAILAQHAHREIRRRHALVEGVVVRHRGRATEQVLEAAGKHARLVSQSFGRHQQPVAAAVRGHVGDPRRGVFVRFAITRARKVAELQVVVRVHQPGQQPVATQVHDAIAARRRNADARDAIPDHAQRLRGVAQRGIHEADRRHAALRVASTTSASGVPRQVR